MAGSTGNITPRGVQAPIRTHKGDRWLDVRDAITADLRPLHLGAIAGLARLHGWAGGPGEQPDELAVQRILAGQPPPGWPDRLSTIRYRLYAMDRTRSIGATEHWTVDPNRHDLGIGTFEKLARDRLSRLPQPHDGSIVIHVDAAVFQQPLAHSRLSVAVGIPRPRPLSSRDQIRMAKIRAQEVRDKDQAMIAMMGRQPDVVHAAASAIQASGANSYPDPVAPPSADQVARAEEMKTVVRVATKAVLDAVLPPGPATPGGGDSTEPPAGTKPFVGWDPDD